MPPGFCSVTSVPHITDQSQPQCLSAERVQTQTVNGVSSRTARRGVSNAAMVEVWTRTAGAVWHILKVVENAY